MSEAIDLIPEDYGIEDSRMRDIKEEYQDWNRDQLLKEIHDLRNCIINYERCLLGRLLDTSYKSLLAMKNGQI